MELSILVAKIAAIAYLSIGIGAVSKSVNFNKLVGDFEKSPGLSMITGVFTLIIGALLVNAHNIWVWEWPVLITILGWGALIKGTLFLACPKFIFYFKGFYKNSQAWGVLIIAIGLLFGYLGFIV